jgi:hypothetical protein
MVELIPTVMKKLQKEKFVVDFCQLLRLINEEKLPLQNIALHLLFNVVRWYSVDNTDKTYELYDEDFNSIAWYIIPGGSSRGILVSVVLN